MSPAAVSATAPNSCAGARTRRRRNAGWSSCSPKPGRSGSRPFLAPRFGSRIDHPAAGFLGGVRGQRDRDSVGALDEHLAFFGIDLARLRMGPDGFHMRLLGWETVTARRAFHAS